VSYKWTSLWADVFKNQGFSANQWETGAVAETIDAILPSTWKEVDHPMQRPSHDATLAVVRVEWARVKEAVAKEHAA